MLPLILAVRFAAEWMRVTEVGVTCCVVLSCTADVLCMCISSRCRRRQSMQEIVELRLQLAISRRRPTPAGTLAYAPDDVARVNKDIDACLQLFCHFLRCYKDDRVAAAMTVVKERRAAIATEYLDGATTLDAGSRCGRDRCGIALGLVSGS